MIIIAPQNLPQNPPLTPNFNKNTLDKVNTCMEMYRVKTTLEAQPTSQI